MLTDEGILARRSSYPCCAIRFMHRAVKAWDRGETECGEENYEKSVYMMWASRIMCDTPIESDTDPGCTSNETATQWAKHADCLCAPCECPEPDTDCTLTPVYTVLEALAFADLPVSPSVDDSYFILSGTNAGSTATWDGADWVYTVVGVFELVWATVTNDYWGVGTGGGSNTGPWFPPPYMLNLVPGIWNATTAYPWMYQGRDIQLQLLGPNGWYNAATATNESLLPQLVDITGLPIVSNDGVRWQYTIDDCVYYSATGSFVPPVNPPAPCDIVPDFTVTQLVDANQEGALLPVGPWFLATNTYDVSNTWSQHVGDIVNTDLTFTPVALGQTVYDIQTAMYYTVTTGGIGPLFPNLIVTYGVGQYTVSSQFPAITAAGNRLVILVDDDGTVVWGGTEDQMPSTLPYTGQFAEPITAIYFYDGTCQFDALVAVVYPEPVPVSILCEDDNLFQYRYTDAQPQQILISAPMGQTIFLSFAAGEMDPGTVIRIYDGTDPLFDPILVSGSYANLGAPMLQTYSTGQYMLIEIEPAITMPDDLLTWQFMASCVAPHYTAIPLITDDCDTYQFNVSAQVDFGGAGTYTFEVYVNGSGTPITFGPYSGESTYDLGDYPIGATVSVIMRNDADPTDYLWLGNLVTNGDCPNDPCAPVPDFSVRLEDCTFFNSPGDAYPGILFLATGTQPSCPPGISVNEVYMWDAGTSEWVTQSIPVGSVLLGNDGTYYVEVSAGVTIPYFQLTVATPTGSTPLNWQFVMPAIQQYGITTNRPVAIQVSGNGIGWTTVWIGNEQDLATPQAAAISFPINQMRSLWWPLTCGYIGPVQVLS